MNNKINSILFIDDDEFTNQLHRFLVEKTGICDTVDTAATVEEAINHLNGMMMKQGQVPDIIFIDLKMPGLDGWDFIHTYSSMIEQSKRKSLMVILTESVDPMDEEKARAIPEIAGFRNKPLTEDMLDEIVTVFFASHAS